MEGRAAIGETLQGRYQLPLWVGVLFLLSVHHRLSFFGDSEYPLNDGALFLAFSEAIRAAGFALPACVEFNRHCIDLAYPPLSFYAVAALAEIGLPMLAIIKWYPLAVTTLYSAFAFVLLRRMIRSELVVLMGMTIFLFYYRSFEFLIMGGGVSRATGGLFWILALIAAERVAHGLRPRRILACGLATGAAILSHLEWGIAAAGSVTLLLACRAPDWRSAILGTLCTGVVAAGTIAPWVATMLSVHGLEPFRNASATSEWHPLLPILRIAVLNIFPYSLMALCVAGSLVAMRRGEWFWLLLLPLALVLVPRSYLTVAALPASVLAAFGLVGLIEIAAHWLREHAGMANRWSQQGLRRFAGMVAAPILALTMVFYQVFMTHAASPAPVNLEQLSPDLLEAMDWARSALDPQTRFVVLSGDHWYADEAAEWFPLLTPFESINTAQGTEWLPGGEFWRRIEAYREAMESLGCGSIIFAIKKYHDAHDAIFDSGNIRCFDDNPFYNKVYSNETVDIIIRKRP